MMEAYFTVESIPRKSEVTFHTLRTRLVATVNARLLNGEFTERGLAKILGVSQPQIHHVLKGARKLQWELAERLQVKLSINLFDLLSDDELAAEDRLLRLLPPTPPPSLIRAEVEGDGVPRKQPARELRILRGERNGHSAIAV